MATKKATATPAKTTALPARRAVTKDAPAKPKAPADATRGALVIGRPAPAFSLPDDGGKTVTLASLAGKKIVLYFYPKNDTPGCTRESCAFQADLAALTKKGAIVIGVSRDGAASHQRFKAKYGLTFPLLTDADKKTHLAYGAWGKKMMYGKAVEGVIRTTVVIDRGGKVSAIFAPVKVDGHAEKVRDAIDAASLPWRSRSACVIPRASKRSRRSPVSRETGGKSELRRAGCRVTPGESDLEESATEKKPPPRARASGGKGEKVE